MRPTPTVHVLCGFIGAGKTTFARKLEQATGALRITKDEWLIRVIGNDPTIDGYADFDSRIVGLSRDIAFRIAEKGMDVILDEGFWRREERDALRRSIDATGANQIWYYLDTPIETIRERVAERNLHLTGDSWNISRELLDGYLKHWQPPDEDEEYILISDPER